MAGTATPVMARGGASVATAAACVGGGESEMEGRVRRQGEVDRALKAAWPGRDGQAGVAARRARRRMVATWPARPDTGRGAGAGERMVARRQAGPACAAGPKRRRRPSKVKNDLFFLNSFLSPNSFK